MVINAPNYSPENSYIQKLTINGKESKSNALNYFDLVNGAELNFEMAINQKK